MSELAPPLEQVIHELTKLPSIGKKTAQRLAFHLLQTPREEAEALTVIRGRVSAADSEDASPGGYRCEASA